MSHDQFVTDVQVTRTLIEGL